MKLDKKFQTGVDWQDFQHKQLIDLFEKVKKARENKKDANAFRYSVAFLVMYVHNHFSLEEAYMKKYDYPDKEYHMKQHKAYRQSMTEFRSSHQDYTEQAMDELIEKVYDWILNHILENDIKLGEFLLKHENI